MTEPEQELSPAPTLRQQLTAALGLPDETFLLEILLSDPDHPSVRCHFYPTPEAMQRAVAVLSEYVLAPKPQTPPEMPEPFVPMDVERH